VSWQAVEAVRDHSESRGAARTVGFVLASHADKYGNNIFIGLDRIMVEAKVGRKSAVDGRRWFLENGEAELTDRPDGQPLMKGRVRMMSMAPLIERAKAAAETAEGSESEPLAKGSESEPQPKEGSPSESTGVRSGAQGVRSAPSISSVSAPETEGDGNETEGETEDARAGARATIPPFEPKRTATQRAAEAQELERELATLTSQLSSSSHPEVTQRAIDTMAAELDELRDEVAA
jgi:hypothetical protein